MSCVMQFDLYSLDRPSHIYCTVQSVEASTYIYTRRGGSRISGKGGLLNNIRGRVREEYSSRPARGSGGVSSPSGVWAAANEFFYIMRKTLYQITITRIARSMYYNRQIRMLETVFWDGPARMPCKFHQQVLLLNSAAWKSKPDQKSVLLS